MARSCRARVVDRRSVIHLSGHFDFIFIFEVLPQPKIRKVMYFLGYLLSSLALIKMLCPTYFRVEIIITFFVYTYVGILCMFISV